MNFWQAAYAAILIIGVPVVVFHAVQDRWAQAIVATIAIAIGVYILMLELREGRQSGKEAG